MLSLYIVHPHICINYMESPFKAAIDGPIKAEWPPIKAEWPPIKAEWPPIKAEWPPIK